MIKAQEVFDNCFRVQCAKGVPFSVVQSFALEKDAYIDKGIEVKERLGISTQKYLLDIEQHSFKITDNKIEYLNWEIVSDDKACLRFKLEEKIHFYGLGDKTGFLDRRGRKYIMWNTDIMTHTPTQDPLYKSVPFLIGYDGEKAFGIFCDNPGRVWFDLGSSDSSCFSIETEANEIDCYFILGQDIPEVLQVYMKLTGKMEIPPLWTLGYHQSKWTYESTKEVLNIANTFINKKIPCDAIHLDIGYMDNFRLFTWDKENFKDPKFLSSELKKNNINLVTIMDAGVKKEKGYKVYDEGKKIDAFCKTPENEDYCGEVWPGESVYPDFTNIKVREWWADLHKSLFESGVSGIWNDMNEPSDFSRGNDSPMERTVPDDTLLDIEGNKGNFKNYHNIYGQCMCMATKRAFDKHQKNIRPYIFTRACYAGIQKYAASWTGDNHSWWEHLEWMISQLCNMGLSGMAFSGADVGGFQDDATPELYARWMQAAAFTPMLRAHSASALGCKANEPWNFGEEVEGIARKYIELRYSLLPYIYNEFHKSSITGMPIMRPLVFSYGKDENTHNLSDQYTVGDNIMIAPIHRPSVRKRLVYFPKGIWYDMWDNKTYQGNQYVIVDAPLDKMPIFIKSGSIIPSIKPSLSTAKADRSIIYLDIYEGDDVSYELYEDDGFTYNYKKGEFNITKFDYKDSKLSVNKIADNYYIKREKYIVRLHSQDGLIEREIDGTLEGVFKIK